MPEDSLPPSIHEMFSFLVIVVENDLTKENVDAIVNAANSWLRHGGGVGYNNIISFLSFLSIFFFFFILFFEEEC